MEDIIKSIEKYLIINNEKIYINALIEICKVYSIYNIDDIINDFTKKNILENNSKYNYLSPNLQLIFINRVRNGDANAREVLILTNYYLVTNIVNKFFKSYNDIDDYIEYGILGLMHAIDYFDKEKDVHFSTYASKCILGYIKRHLPSNINSVSIGRNFFYLISKIYRIEEDLMIKFNKTHITNQEILDELNKEKYFLKISIEDISILREYAKSTLSLDYEINNFDSNDNLYIMDSVASDDNVEEEVINKLYNEVLSKIISGEIDSRLTPVELKVLWYRYGFDEEHIYRSSDETGKILHISGSRVRQVERSAIRKLRSTYKLYSGETTKREEQKKL